MGYTTTFTGRFDVYRPESPIIGQFLKDYRTGDEASKNALCDHLQEIGDPRGKLIASRRKVWPLFGMSQPHRDYLLKFASTRRMKRDAAMTQQLPDPLRLAAGLPIGVEGGNFVNGEGFAGDGMDNDLRPKTIIDHNQPPEGQPGLWCQWMPTGDGTAIVWNKGEKFYNYVAWLDYLIQHFLKPWGYIVNGTVKWSGEGKTDRGVIQVVENNRQF